MFQRLAGGDATFRGLPYHAKADTPDNAMTLAGVARWPLRVALLVLMLAVAAGAAQAQQAGAQDNEKYTAQTVPLPAEGESTRDFRRVVGGSDATGFASQSRAELQIAVAPMPLAEITSRTEAAVSYLETVAQELGRTLIRYERARDRGASTEELDDIRRRAELIDDFKQALANRCNILIEAAEDKGADKAAERRYVDVVSSLRAPAPETAEEQPTEEQLAREAVRQVREEPPVHEREKPWTISVDELVLEMQPLQRDDLEERVGRWLDILQRQVRERIRIDIALKKTDAQGQREVLAAMANEQQVIIGATVERLQAALTVLAKRGGDTSVAQRYIANATGQRVDLTDPSVFYAQGKAWLTSPTGGLSVGLDGLKFLAIILVFWLVSGVIGAVISAGLKRLPKKSSLLNDFLVGGSRRVMMVIGLLVAISAVGINITPLAAAIGAAGLVIGLALQGTLSNFASGILILIYRPFDVGDVINAGGVFGKVDAMTLVSTRILTFDNQVNLVPNNSIWNNVITNATALDTRRVDLTFGIGYADDAGKAQGLIEEIVQAHPKVLETPAPTIKMNALGDSSVDFVVRPWARTADYWDVYWDILRQVKEAFDREGINIPYPQRDLHLSGPIEVVMGGGRRRTGGAKSEESPAPSSTSSPATTDAPPPPDDDEDDASREPGPPAGPE